MSLRCSWLPREQAGRQKGAGRLTRLAAKGGDSLHRSDRLGATRNSLNGRLVSFVLEPTLLCGPRTGRGGPVFAGEAFIKGLQQLTDAVENVYLVGALSLLLPSHHRGEFSGRVFSSSPVSLSFTSCIPLTLRCPNLPSVQRNKQQKGGCAGLWPNRAGGLRPLTVPGDRLHAFASPPGNKIPGLPSSSSFAISCCCHSFGKQSRLCFIPLF